MQTLRERIRRRLDTETGTVFKSAPNRVALVYPSPYRVGMSSLGFQRIYSELNDRSDTVAERAFLPDDIARATETRECVATYESATPIAEFPVVALSVAYEIEIAGMIQTLELGGIPALRDNRDAARHPFVLAGGPLTFSNPTPLAPFVDAVILGEAEDVIHRVIDVLASERDFAERLGLLSRIEHVWVPAVHGSTKNALPMLARSERIPAHARIIAADTELSGMFLIEAERGCSRGCQYCVMRRSTNGGMRVVPAAELLERIPEHARKVGLVGAAVSDHPKIVEIVRTLADRGIGVGLSSLRPDRLDDAFVAALAQAGYRTLTTAMDGPSERLRAMLERRARENHLERAAELARLHGMQKLKLYLMLGLPTETDDDIEECVQFVSRLSRRIPIALGIAPFVSKRNTPLDQLQFAGIAVVEKRIERLRRGLRGRAEVRPTSARWAWVEWVLAQGGEAEGRAVYSAVQTGGAFRDYRRAFEAIPRVRALPVLPVHGPS